MQVWHDVGAAATVPSAVAIGVFDGVHRGHQAVIAEAVEQAATLSLRSVVVTFDPNPMSVVRPDSAVPAVGSLRHRLERIEALGVDAVLVLRFDREMAAHSAEWFVRDVLVDTVGARVVVVGEDFRFGHRASGDVALLSSLGEAHGYVVRPVGAVGADGRRWSSTLVRQLVADGDVAAAAEVLGAPFRVEGVVRRGEGRGRELGYPTANVSVPDGLLAPADGVYAGWLARLDDSARRMPAAISVGSNPTFDGVDHRVESYVMESDSQETADLDLYDHEVAVELVTRLRAMERFPSVDDLVEQMAVDVEAAREVLRAAAMMASPPHAGIVSSAVKPAAD